MDRGSPSRSAQLRHASVPSRMYRNDLLLGEPRFAPGLSLAKKEIQQLPRTITLTGQRLSTIVFV